MNNYMDKTIEQVDLHMFYASLCEILELQAQSSQQMQVFANPLVSIFNQFSTKSESMANEIDLTLRAHLITLLRR